MRRRWRELSFEKKLSVVVMPLVLAVLSGLVLPLLLSSGDDPEPPPKPPARAASLSIPDVVVGNPVRAYRDVDDSSGATEQTTSTLPAVELALHNVGSRRAIVRRARFTIRKHVRLPVCVTSGDLGVGRTYGIVLPPDAATGTVVESAPLRRQLAPDEAEVLRFRFTLGASKRDGDHLYEIEISILHSDAASPQRAGTVLLSLPGSPDEEQLWSPSEEADRQTSIDSWGPGVVACWERNTNQLLDFLRTPGERGPELEALQTTYRKARVD